MPVIIAVLRSPTFKKIVYGVLLVVADVIATEAGRKKVR